MKHLYFARHGVSEMNQKNFWSGDINTPLAPEGHEQAKRAGDQAKATGLKFDLIISSPLDRAYDTAKHIAESVQYPVESILVNELFKERHLGRLEGTPRKYFVALRYITNEASVDKYGAEPFADLQKRAEKALAYLHTLPEESILVVAHSAFGRALYNAVHNSRKRKTAFKNAEIVKFI
jgi:broad specificity phosphatase PhoE